MDSYAPFLMLLFNIAVLYLLSKHTINNLAWVLQQVFHHQRIVYSMIALFFFPGTVLHEMAHFLMAVILFLKVKHMSLIPEWEGDHIRLGSVTYIKRDVVRSILVGVAPVFMGIAALWWLSVMHIFPAPLWWQNILLGYIILVISSTMFSSKQDLVDALYIVPIIAIITAIVWFFDINLTLAAASFSKTHTFEDMVYHLNRVNMMLWITMAIHIVAVVSLMLLMKLLRPNYHR